MRNKSTPKAILIIPIIFLAVFIYAQFQNHPKNNSAHYSKSEKISKIFVDENLKNFICPHLEKYFKDQNKKYQITNQDSAEIIISSKNESDDTAEKIGKIFQNSYQKISNTSWQAKSNLIYYSTSSKDKKLATGFKNYLTGKLSKLEWNLNAVGDIMLARHVGKKMITSENWNLPFLKTADQLSSADITFANLESPFAEAGQKIFEGMVFGADPMAIAGLKTAGIDIVSLANNHFGNQGKVGMKYTMNFLTQNGIKYTGAGNNFTQAHTATIINIKGLKVAFLGYNGVNSTPNFYAADSNSAGLASWNISQLQRDLAATKKLKPNVIIVSLHAGVEYSYQPNSDQINFARKAIDSGADLVIGHHPHCIEPIENYHGKFIFYSLGNFVFDQMWSEQTKEGLTIKLTFADNKVVKIELNPVYIIDYNQPHFVTGRETDKILANILPLSNF